MKKLLSIVFIVMGILIALVSCKKSEDFTSVQKEEIRIFFKSTNSSQLKSGSLDVQVKSGDTINSPINGNAIVYTEDANGEAVKVDWFIYSTKNDNPIDFFVAQPVTLNIDQTSLMFPEYGIYKVTAKKENTQFNFFVKVLGVPGKIGDESKNNFIFRLEKKNLSASHGGKHRFLFIYYKFDNKGWFDQKPVVVLNIYKNLQSTSPTRETRDLLKWQFSEDKNDNYYYFILDLEKAADLGDSYGVGFYISQKTGSTLDGNVLRSSWYSGLWSIKFFIP